MLKKYLTRHWPSVLTGNILAVLLGFIAAIVAAMIGPSIQILMSNNPEQVVSATEVFGERFAPVIIWLTGLSQINANTFLHHLPIILVSLAGIKALCTLAQWFVWERTGEVISREMRSDLMADYFYLNPAIRGRKETSLSEENLASVLSTDIKLMREYVVRFYGGLPREGLQVIFLTITLILLSPKLFMVFSVFVAPAVFIVSRLGKKLRRRTAKALQDYSEMAEWLQQRLLGIETIKHYRTEAVEAQKMVSLNESMHQRFLRAAKVKARTSPVIELVAAIGFVAVVYFALKQIDAGEVSGAVQLSFFSSLALLSQSANKVGHYYNSNREGSAAISRIEQMFKFVLDNRQEAIFRPQLRKSAQVALSMEKVSLNYYGSAESAVTDFNYKFEGGKIYCLVGPSGAGKSSLFKAILGLVPLTKGQIIVECKDRKSDEIFAYMPQKVMLAPVSIAENISYPAEKADAKKVSRAISEVGLEKVIGELADREMTTVGIEGRTLSGGQAQRVQLARICYHENPIVLVDEGTSALDPESEQIIYSSLQKMAAKGWLVIMIAHRPSATKISDQILLMEKGRLVKSAPQAL